MGSSPESSGTSGSLLDLLFQYPFRWLLPTIVVGGVLSWYALTHSATWEASQALMIRNEAASSQAGPGKFSQTDEMKTVQETIVELAKSHGVLTPALTRVGPPPDYPNKSLWPTAQDVADLSDHVRLVPPKGTEFGRTEVFYLRVKAKNRQRAIDLTDALCRQLESSFQGLRNAKAQSMIAELIKVARVSQDDLADSTRRLNTLERRVGSDLAELRLLSESSGGDSTLRRTITEIRGELRLAYATQQSYDGLLAQLQRARHDPGELVNTPSQLLDSQPALKRLKEGLVDAQLRTAVLLGKMTEHHPLVRAAREGEQEIGRQLHDELASAVRSIEAQSRLGKQRIAMLEEQLHGATQRLEQLADLRAEYVNLAAETRNRSELVQRAEQRLAEVRAGQATAITANLIARIDRPDTGPKPVGPSRSLLVLLGMTGGLAAGLGVLVLTSPSPDGFAPIPAARDCAKWEESPHGKGGKRVLSFTEALEKLKRLRN